MIPSSTHRTLSWQEWVPRTFPASAINGEHARRLVTAPGRVFAVEAPSNLNDQQWKLTPQGWVGTWPLDATLTVRIEPKVPISNVFRMLTYAYDLADFHDPLRSYSSLDDLFTFLVNLLSQRVLARERRGLYRAYVEREEKLPVVRGRLNVNALARNPGSILPVCAYEEHTADVPENQILAWTLWLLARSTTLPPAERTLVRQGLARLRGAVTMKPFSGDACRHRAYTRLNDDYRPMHALCAFLLDHAGPTHGGGSHAMMGFLVNMGELFERFVAEWMGLHLPADVELFPQVQVTIDRDHGIQFYPDLQLKDGTGRHVVADTKYKSHLLPDEGDVQQILAYALSVGSRDAVLIYPHRIENPVRTIVGGIRFRTLGFDLSQDLEIEGPRFLDALLD